MVREASQGTVQGLRSVPTDLPKECGNVSHDSLPAHRRLRPSTATSSRKHEAFAQAFTRYGHRSYQNPSVPGSSHTDNSCGSCRTTDLLDVPDVQDCPSSVADTKPLREHLSLRPRHLVVDTKPLRGLLGVSQIPNLCAGIETLYPCRRYEAFARALDGSRGRVGHRHQASAQAFIAVRSSSRHRRHKASAWALEASRGVTDTKPLCGHWM